MRKVACLFLVACLVATLPPSLAQASPPWTRTDFTVTSFDGTALAASVWVPTAATPTPAILITNGWNNRHDMGTELRLAERYANQGYVVLGWTSRGWGNSGGEVELDGPKEQNDTRAMIDLLATNRDKWHVMMEPLGPCTDHIIHDIPKESQRPLCPNLSTTDPRVGMVGESYGGGIQLLAAQGDPRIDSIVPRITWNNLLTSLAPHDVLKIGWVTELYATGQTVSRGAPAPTTHPGDQPDQGGPSQKLSEWYAESSAMNGPTEEMRQEIGWVRSVHPGKLATPTLLIQGWGDTLFPPSEALATFADLRARNVTTRLILYPGGHGQTLAADSAASMFVDQQMDDWLNVTLRNRPAMRTQYPVLRYRDTEKDYAADVQWPPTGTTMWHGYLGAAGKDGLTATIPAAAKSTDLVNPVFPATCVDVPSFQTEAGSNCPSTAPGTSGVWIGPALGPATEVTGTPHAHLVVTSTQPSDVRLFLTLEDVDAAGSAVPIGRQTMPLRMGPASSTAIDIDLQTVSHTFPSGHSIGLQIAATDLGFYASREPGRITISSSGGAASWLDVPMVAKDAWKDHEPPIIAFVNETSPQSACPGKGHCVRTLVFDNLQVANVTFTGAPDIQTQLQPGPHLQPAAGRGYQLDYVVGFDGDANTTLLVTARDEAGNSAHATWRTGVRPAFVDCGDPPEEQLAGGRQTCYAYVDCSPGEAVLAQGYKCRSSGAGKGSPAAEPWVLVVVLATVGMLVRRRAGKRHR